MIRPFLIALQFLTRLPVRLDGDPQGKDIGRSILYYPLIGLLLGLLFAATAWSIQDVPVLPRAALLLAVWVITTGALHLDGLADSIDAWAGGHGERERTLAIMKDPASGPMGVAAVVLVLLVKFAALAALCELGNPWAIVAPPLLGRTVLPLLFLTTPYVRPGGLGHALATQLPERAAVSIVLITSAAIAAVAGMAGLTLLSAGAAVFLLLRSAMRRRLGGTTGDTAGALVELTEVATLVAAVLLATPDS